MTTYYNKNNPTLSLDPTAKDLATQQGGASDITFEQRLANSGYAPMQSPTATSGATTQKTVNAADLMAGRVDANGNPTVGQAYSGLIPSADPNLEAAYAAQGKMFQDATAPVDENTIRANTQARFQAEVDALNRVYAEKKAQAAIQGEGRLGQGAAINARRGLIGSDFGNAQNAKIADQNMQIQNDIQDELGMKIAGINSKIASSVAEELAAKQAARQQGAQQYIDFLKGAAQRKDDRTTTAVGSLVGNGITPDESVFANMASQLGTTVDDVKLKYNAAKAAYDAKTLAAKPKAQEVSAGASLVDPITGKVIYQGTSNTANDKPVSLSPGEILVDPVTGKAIFTAPNKPTDNKPITQVVNKQLLQYDPATNKWNVVSRGGGGNIPGNGNSNNQNSSSIPISPEVASWVTNIQNGTAKITSVPAKLKNAVSLALANGGNASSKSNELKQNALKSAQDLLAAFDNGNTYAVGKSAILPVLPGTDAQDFVSQFDNLKSLLSLDNVKLLKNQGAVSDSERKLLEDASTKLDRKQTEPEFRKTLQELVATLATENKNATQAPINTPAAIQVNSTLQAAKNQYGISY